MVIIFPYAEREPRETWLTWLVWGKILGMNPHLGVTNTNLEKQLVCMRIFCKITRYWLCGLQILRSKLALTVFLGRVWSRQNTALPHEKEGNQLFYLFSSRLWAVMPWRGTICLSLALNQLPFPFINITIIILISTAGDLQAGIVSGLVNLQLSQSKESNEGAKCPRAGGGFCQSWTLPEAKHLGIAYGLKWKQSMFSGEPSFPILFIACSVSKVIFFLILISLLFSTTLFVFAFHLLSWFPVSPSCLEWLILRVKLFFHAVEHNLKMIPNYFTFIKLTYLSLKNIISPRKVVTASKVKSGPQVFGSAGSFDSVGSFISVDSVWLLWVLEDGHKRSSLWKKLKWEVIQVYAVHKNVTE